MAVHWTLFLLLTVSLRKKTTRTEKLSGKPSRLAKTTAPPPPGLVRLSLEIAARCPASETRLLMCLAKLARSTLRGSCREGGHGYEESHLPGWGATLGELESPEPVLHDSLELKPITNKRRQTDEAEAPGSLSISPRTGTSTPSRPNDSTAREQVAMLQYMIAREGASSDPRREFSRYIPHLLYHNVFWR